MIKFERSQKIFLIKNILFFSIILIFFRFIVIPITNTDQFRLIVENIGIFGYLLVIIYIVLSHVLAPISGTPGVLLAYTVYGPFIGTILLFIAGMISATINFYISRRYGRKVVKKLAGKDALNKIDSISLNEEKKTLIIARFFGFTLFDFISYAYGLTNMPYKTYISITFITSLIVNIILYLLYRNFDFTTSNGVTIWYVFMGITLLIAFVLFSILFKRVKTKH